MRTTFSFILSSLLFITVTHGRPSLRPRGFASTTLKEEYQATWLGNGQAPPVNGDTAAESPNAPGNSKVNPLAYHCIGPMMDDFPTPEKWPLCFDQMWNINSPAITTVNGGNQFNVELRNAINAEAEKTRIDARIILALVMQESTGQINAPCTNGGADCGLLQIRGGLSFAAGASIALMLEQGIEGIPGWPGYLNYFNGDTLVNVANGGVFWKGNPFAAARLYNKGYLVDENLTLMNGGESPSTYAHDIAARLFGWNGRVEGCNASKTCPGLGFDARLCW